MAGDDDIDRIANALAGAEVLLYALPAERPAEARAYAEAALHAGVAFVNTTPDLVARDPQLLQRFAAAGLPLVGDDLASHFGTSTVHRTLLDLLRDRGLTLDSSYQLNLGGNEDFRNLSVRDDLKRQSKLNALGTSGVEMLPFGYLPHLGDQKIAHVNIEGRGWGGTPVSLEVRLKVHDSSGAAGVTIDLVRLAALARRRGRGGFVADAADLLKSPP